jgi:hypothetical protein
MSNRRAVLGGLAGLAALGASETPFAAPATDLNLDDAATNLRSYIKLRGDLTGEPVFDLIRGRVYGLVAGQPARPLFKTVGAQRTAYSRRSPLEYAASTRYIGLLLDWRTERLLRTWQNPYTGGDCQVPVTRYGPAEMRFLADRMVPASLAPDEPPRGTRPWFLLGDVVHMLDEIIAPAPAGVLQPDADLMTFTGSLQQLVDPGLTRIPARLSFTAVEPWRDWMRMEKPGSLWWHVAGAKLDGPDGYGPELRALVQAEDPAFFAMGAGG